MVRVTAQYTGNLHTHAEHGPSGAVLETDAPKDNEGEGACFSPTDLVGTALGTCMLTIMGIVARRHGWPLEGARVGVEKAMAADPHRRIASLDVHFNMPKALDPKARSVLEKAAEGCPVHHSLSERTQVTMRFDYDV